MCLITSRWCTLLLLACVVAVPAFGQNGPDGSAAPIQLDGHQQRHVITAQSAQQILEFQNLIPGETYSLVVPADPALGTCRPDVKAADPGIAIKSYDAEAHQLSFVAGKIAMRFELDYPCTWSPDNPPRHYVSLACQTCLKKDLQSYVDAAVLDVQGGQGIEDLVRNVLIGGDCFDVTGITFLGNAGQVGTFSNGLTNVGFNTGLIMATGDISVAPGPNDADNASAGYGTSTPDADLATLTAGSLFDRAGIEFDFTPTQSPVTFNFVFASEEYCEYVGTQFNDVFGFFISGPGIPGGTANIALIPATSIPIAINNVNHLSNSGYYVNNQPASSGNLCGQQPSSSPVTNELQYDGYTRKFTAVANVQTCQTYHMKLKIADVGDGVWDSAVFLNAGSFDAGGNASVEWVVNGVEGATEVFEGCGTVQLIFHRVGGNPNIPLPVQYTISGTATPGLDYSAIPPVVVIPAGQTQVIITVNIVVDALIEGQESIKIKLSNACSCLHPEEILLINDLPPLKAVADTVTICGAGTGTVNVDVPSGVPPFTYQWQNGSTDPSATVFVGASSNVKVTVTDGCGKTTVATARVIVHPLPLAQLLPPAPQICDGQDALIKVKFTGTGPFEFVYLLNGDPQSPITGITDNPFFLTINQPGLYQVLSVTDSAGCQGTGQGALLVQPSALQLTGVVTNVQCSSSSNGSINTTVTGGQGPYTYAWAGPVNIPSTNPDPINLPAGAYTVTVTDGFGCTDVQQFTIIAPNALTTTIAAVTGTNCANPNAGTINLDVTGGFPNYTYKWSGGVPAVQDPVNLTMGTYTVTVTDQSGCSKTVTATVPGDFVAPAAVGTTNQQLTCLVTNVTLDGTGSSVGANYSYLWTANPGSIVSGSQSLNPVVNLAGNYTLRVTNALNGCTATAVVPVSSNTAPPAAEAGPVQSITCAITNVILDGTGSSTGPNFSYLWTASPGGVIVSGNNTLSPVVSAAGTYTLLVTNTITGCTKTDNVTVNLNTAAPTAVIGPAGTLTCTVSLVTLNGSATPAGGTYSYQWNTLNGNILSGQASANAVVTEAGDYTLVVTNAQNGCTDDASVVVKLDFTDPASIVVVNDQITCTNKTVKIDGTASSNGPGYSFFWSTSGGGNIISGATTLTPTVNTPGFYSLFVTNLVNNCTASASVQVTQNTIPPIVNPGTAGTITCNTTTIELGDPATIVLPYITYQWTSSAGGNIVSGANTPSIILDQPATYSLLVTNTQNGCTATGVTVIAGNTTPPSAVASTPGQINCVTPALQLNGIGSSTGVNYTYDWTTTDGVIAAGAATLTPTVTKAGTYTLLVTNGTNGCTSTASVTVTASLTPPTVAVAQPGILTCAQPQLTLNAAGTSTGNEFKYQWGTQGGQIISGGNSLQPVVGLAGTYTLIVTNTTNNCTASTSATVSANLTPPLSDAGAPQTLNCQLTSIALNGGGSSQGANFSYQWAAVGGGNIIPPTNILNPVVDEPGVYQLKVTNTQNGCTALSTVEILQDATDPVVQIAAPDILNCTNSSIVLLGTGSSTGNNINYAWSGPGIVSGGSSLNATVNKPGDYTMTITNSTNNCTSVKTVSVAQDIQAPAADAGAGNILNCYHPQLELGGTGTSIGQQYSYNWSGPGIVSGGNSPVPVVDKPGLYTLVITNTVNGCSATDNVTLDLNQDLPAADAGPGFQLTCVITSYVLNPTVSQGAEYVYNWSTNTGNFLTSKDTLAPEINGAGTYFLTVTNTINGCTATDLVLITRSADFPNADAGTSSSLTCAVQSLTLNGGNSSTGPKFGYTWTAMLGGNILSGSNSLSPVINEPGTYQLAVIDSSNSCVSYSSVVIPQDIALPQVEAGSPQTLTCTLSSLSLQGQVNSNGNFLYNWQASNGGNILSGANTLSPVVTAVGNYTFQVTNTINGCINADSVAVLADQNAPVVAMATPAVLTCVVKEVTLDATGSTTGNVQYTWTTPAGNFTSLSDPVHPKVDKPGDYQLSILNKDNGCVTANSIKVTQDIKPPVAEAGFGQTLTCALTTVVLNGSNSSQNGPYFYTWTSPNGTIVTGEHSLTPTISAPGGYGLSVLNTENGCSSTDQVEVLQDIQKPMVVIASAPVITCAVPLVTLDGTASSFGPNISYSWSTNDGYITSGQNNIQAQANAAGLYTLTILNNINGCSDNSNVSVTENTILPDVDAGPPYTLTCTIEQVSLQAFASSGQQFVYTWTTPDGKIVSGDKTLTPLVNHAGLYSLLVTNSSTGCKKSDDVQVFQEMNIPTDFEFDVQRPTCKDNDGLITFKQVAGGVGPYMYSINDGQSFNTQLDFQSIAPGPYDLWIQDANGCEFHKKVIVPATPDPSISIDPEFNIQLGDSLQLKAVLVPGYSLSLIDSITWTPLEGLTFLGNDMLSRLKPIAKPFKPTEYTVTIYSVDGCQASDRVLIRVDNEPHIYIPNAFSPWDEDAHNDIVYISADGDQIVKINSFQIFDRWGTMVFRDVNFQPNDPHHGWNGFHHNKLMDPAVFVYYAEIELIDGRKLLYKGDITLVR